MTPPKPLNYGRHLVEQDDIDAVVSVLQGDLITQGPMVEQFESALAKQVEAKFAVAVTDDLYVGNSTELSNKTFARHPVRQFNEAASV